MIEMTELNKQIEIELLTYEESKNEATNKMKGLIGSVSGLVNLSNEETIKEVPVKIEKTSRAAGVFNKFKK